MLQETLDFMNQAFLRNNEDIFKKFGRKQVEYFFFKMAAPETLMKEH